MSSVIAIIKDLAIPIEAERIEVDHFNRRLMASAIKLVTNLMDRKVIAASTEHDIIFESLLDLSIATQNTQATKALIHQLQFSGSRAREPMHQLMYIRFASHQGDYSGMRLHWDPYRTAMHTPIPKNHWRHLSRSIQHLNRADPSQKSAKEWFVDTLDAHCIHDEAFRRSMMRRVSVDRFKNDWLQFARTVECPSTINDQVDHVIANLVTHCSQVGFRGCHFPPWVDSLAPQKNTLILTCMCARFMTS